LSKASLQPEIDQRQSRMIYNIGYKHLIIGIVTPVQFESKGKYLQLPVNLRAATRMDEIL